MATSTYTPIASITLGSSASSVTFSSIPQDYRDLVLVSNVTFSGDNGVVYRFNNDSATNYYYVVAAGNGSSTLTDASSRSRITALYSTQTRFLEQLDIMDYSVTDKETTVLARSDSPGFTVMGAHRWDDTAAITQIEAFALSGSFQTGNTFALYGIEA